jgi:hypothetical protein
VPNARTLQRGAHDTLFLPQPAPWLPSPVTWCPDAEAEGHRVAPRCNGRLPTVAGGAMRRCRLDLFTYQISRDRKTPMKHLLATLAWASLALASALAHAQAPIDKETREDIVRHRAMAAAHEAAAKCLEAGKGHDSCQKELQTACKNLAIGKYCGMKHGH